MRFRLQIIFGYIVNSLKCFLYTVPSVSVPTCAHSFPIRHIRYQLANFPCHVLKFLVCHIAAQLLADKFGCANSGAHLHALGLQWVWRAYVPAPVRNVACGPVSRQFHIQKLVQHSHHRVVAVIVICFLPLPCLGF